jgi:hypothetical protein
VRRQLRLPADVPATDSNIFYAAFSYIRIHSAAAMAEIERQVGEYKLFRSLTLLFLLDLPLAYAAQRLVASRLAISLIVVALSYYRFQWLLDWSYRLTFDFYLQLRPTVLKR